MVKDIDSLEKVQRRAPKLVTSLAKLTYDQRLRHLRLHSLYCWRQRGDLIETFKILNGLENVEAGKFLETETAWTYQRAHNEDFQTESQTVD